MRARINFSPTPRDIRVFGLTILIGFGLIGARLHWIGKVHGATVLWAVTGGIALLSWVFPTAARPFYWLWMAFGLAIGSVTSRIVMAVIFYLVLTPAGWIRRRGGRDPLALRKSGESYWRDHPRIEGKSYYEHLF